MRITEAIYYPEYRVFGVQHHPEWQEVYEDAPQWTLDKIAELCWGEEKRRKLTNEVVELFGV